LSLRNERLFSKEDWAMAAKRAVTWITSLFSRPAPISVVRLHCSF
jgi:hypothetical protein